jgi:hypothetical protein
MSFIQARPVATYDLYAQIHKGLRLGLSTLLVRLGACGGDDAVETAQLLADLRAQLAFSLAHLQHEEAHVHTALEARAPGAAVALESDHDHHRCVFGELELLIAGVEAAEDATRAAALKRLYLRFSLFVAEDFVHMAMEEQQILPVLQSLFTDAELHAIEEAIVSSLSPEKKVFSGRLMAPAATRAERIEFMATVRETAPPEVFGPLLAAVAESTLSPADYAHLRAGLGLQASRAGILTDR